MRQRGKLVRKEALHVHHQMLSINFWNVSSNDSGHENSLNSERFEIGVKTSGHSKLSLAVGTQGQLQLRTVWRRWANKSAQLHKLRKHNLVDLILKYSLMNRDQHNAQLIHALVMWAGLKNMIKRMKPESAITTSCVNRVHKIQKRWQKRNRVQHLSRYGIWILGLKISHSFT